MSTTIYYFTGTGNSLSIARRLQEGLTDCSLVPVVKCMKVPNDTLIAESEVVGFVFPLYFYSIPEIILKFVKSIDLSRAKYLFAVVTRGGGWWQGSALGHLKKCLKQQGYNLSAGFYIRMPDNYIP
jgi:flavodoxin